MLQANSTIAKLNKTPTLFLKGSERARPKIPTSQIANRLKFFVYAEVKLSATQVTTSHRRAG
jgi:hypothetical protein